MVLLSTNNQEERKQRIKEEINPHKRRKQENNYEKTKPSLNPLLLLAMNDSVKNLNWIKIGAENLDLDYVDLFSDNIATDLLNIFEEEFQYFTGELSKIKVFGKWHDLPRKQVTYGDEGLTYKYSGLETPALPWPPVLSAVKDVLLKVTGHDYNFVLVNRYKDGAEKMGEHKDDEKELDVDTPIASLSFGSERYFYFKHQDSRGKSSKRKIEKVNIKLINGSLLLMNQPTNQYWYHALPPRKNVKNVRVNLTFRKIVN